MTSSRLWLEGRTYDPYAPDDAEGPTRRVRWMGEATYRVLSYYFSVRWNRAELGRYVHRVMEGFAVPPDPTERRNPPTPGLPAMYSLVDLGPAAEVRFHLLFGDGRWDARLLGVPESAQMLHHFFWHVNSEAARRTGDFLLVHAGSVATPSGSGVLLPGGSGSGKTTLTAGLVRAGFGYLSDEAGAVDPVSGLVYPYPKALTLKGPAIRMFVGSPNGHGGGTRKGGSVHLRPDDIRPGSAHGPCRIGYVIAPTYRRGEETSITPISRAESLVHLADNSFNLNMYGSRALPLLARALEEARCFRLVSGDLEEAVAAVERATGPG